jgi:hypothetical protein
MQSNTNVRREHQLQERISRIAEEVLMLGGALTALKLLAMIALSLLKWSQCPLFPVLIKEKHWYSQARTSLTP